MTLQSGIHSLPAAQYHADPCPEPSLSNSIANILLTQSPLHARLAHPRLNPNYQPEESSRFDLGSAAHMMLLERRTDQIVIVNADDWRTKAAKEARDLARANGQTPVLTRHYDLMNEMAAAAYGFIATTELNGIFELGHAEQTVIWQEGATWCRARPDLLLTREQHAHHHVVLDYKTTENAEPEAFIRQIGRMSHDLQAEWYVRGVKSVTGQEPVFVFLAQETSPPYACSLVSLANAYRAVGQSKVSHALTLWMACTQSNKWPSYSTRIHYAEPPAWDLAALDEPKNTSTEDEGE
jgi:PDDEXK-like domain of unknown function (DUF3799)